MSSETTAVGFKHKLSHTMQNSLLRSLLTAHLRRSKTWKQNSRKWANLLTFSHLSLFSMNFERRLLLHSQLPLSFLLILHHKLSSMIPYKFWKISFLSHHTNSKTPPTRSTLHLHSLWRGRSFFAKLKTKNSTSFEQCLKPRLSYQLVAAA